MKNNLFQCPQKLFLCCHLTIDQYLDFQIHLQNHPKHEDLEYINFFIIIVEIN